MATYPTTAEAWSFPKKLGLRFGFIFTVLFIFLLDWYATGFSKLVYLFTPLGKGLDYIIPAIGKHLFNISYTIVSPTPATTATVPTSTSCMSSCWWSRHSAQSFGTA